ncbi:FliH/SctL family protein [Limnohabitans sp. DM1]|uniref:FliH/SctL family protein n=1 Tax=Limnohabitans sp. DM1 TaxID=1597955 RepID=UPI000ADFF0FD|nr:FliH/SctL family protein [Limnohabitans sp. DM1]
MFKPPKTSISALIPSEHITHFVNWNFPDVSDPMGHKQYQMLEHEKIQIDQAREAGQAIGYELAQAEFDVQLALEMQAFIQQQQKDNAVQLHALLTSAQEGWNLVQAQLAESVMRLVVDMSSQVVCHVLDTQYHDTLQAVIRQAVDTLTNSDSALVVRLCPADWSAMQAFLPMRLQERDVKWLPDRSLQANQCFVESAGQRVDASLSSRMELAKKLLLFSPQEQEGGHA